MLTFRHIPESEAPRYRPFLLEELRAAMRANILRARGLHDANGRCPRCQKPLDDHDWSTGEPRCR